MTCLNWSNLGLTQRIPPGMGTQWFYRFCEEMIFTEAFISNILSLT